MRADSTQPGHRIYISPNKLVTVKASKDNNGIRQLQLQADTGPALWVALPPDAEVLVARGRKVDVT